MNTFKPITGHLAENADGNRQHPTEGEKNFIRFCKRMSIPYEFQVPIYCDEKGYILDFELTYEYSTKKNVRKAKYVVELDYEVLEKRADLKINGKKLFTRLIIQKRK